MIRDALSALRPTFTSNATSRMRRLGDGQRLAYLASTDLAPRTCGADVRALGRARPARQWYPRPRRVGSTFDSVTGSRWAGRSGSIRSRTRRPSSWWASSGDLQVGWERDPLAGSGCSAAYSDGSLPRLSPAYGPFVVDDATFLASGSTVDALQVTGHPRLDNATDASMNAAAKALRSADGLLSARVGDRADISRVASDLPQTLSQVHAQQAATRSTFSWCSC